MQSSTIISKSINQVAEDSKTGKVVTGKELNKILPKLDANKSTNSKSNALIPKINDRNTSTGANIVKKVPVLKITINKKYNKQHASHLDINKHTSSVTSNVNVARKTDRNEYNEEIKSGLKDCTETTTASSKPMVFNLVPIVFEKPPKIEDAIGELKNIYTPKTAYTRKGDLSRDHSRYQTTTEKIRYLYTKARRDCDILTIRLKALKERHKQEKEEMRKLKIQLGDSCNDITKEALSETTGYTKRKRSEEEDEYERLLRKVRKMREDALNPKYYNVKQKIERNKCIKLSKELIKGV